MCRRIPALSQDGLRKMAAKPHWTKQFIVPGAMKFKRAKAETQAKSAIKAILKLDPKAIPSLRSKENYQQGLKNVCQWLKDSGFRQSLRDLTKEQAMEYLKHKSASVEQSTLDMDRQAIQKMFQVLTHKLEPEEKLPVIKSQLKSVKEARAYFKPQMEAIAERQSPHYALATKISYASGLRAHEFFTLRKLEERAPDARPESSHKFKGREPGVLYTVKGKGGLVRTVSIPKELSKELEKYRLETPYHFKDRTIRYTSYYNLEIGQKWSQNVTAVSREVCGFSNGAHGFRHSYAQDRMQELMKCGVRYHEALETVSQEMGHFRPDITLEYLR